MEGTNREVTAWRKSSHSGSNNGNCVEVGTWRKSSYSGSNNGDCVEVGAWRKSSHSADNNGNCVEVGGGPIVVVRDTQDREGAALAFGADAWARFAATIRNAGNP